MKKLLVINVSLCCFALLLFAAGFPLDINRSGLSDKEKAGQLIYEKGIGSTDIPVTALMSGVKVPGTVMPCINCHKKDGTGNPEGGIVPSDIRWSQLTKHYGNDSQSGRSHPAYTESSLRKVISMGIDPAGNKLNTVMPRYSMSRTDIDNLIAYLKVLDHNDQQGVTDQSISLGVVLPEYNHPDLLKVVQELVIAYCDEVNVNGGVFQRRLEPNFILLSRKSSIAEVKEQLRQAQSFAYLGVGLVEHQKTLESFANAHQVPMLLPFSKLETLKGIKNKNVFYLYPSLLAESKTVIDYSCKNTGLKGVAVVYREDNLRKELLNELKEVYRVQSGKMIATHSTDLVTAKVVENWKAKGIESIVFIGNPQEGKHLLHLLETNQFYPNVYLPGSVSGLNLFQTSEQFSEKVFIGYPTWGSVVSKSGLEKYQKLLLKYDLSSKWKNNQMNTMAMLMLIDESLKKSGRSLDKEKVIKGLEGLFQYTTGLIPPVSYSINERVGSKSIYITTYDNHQKKMKLLTTISSEL